MTVILPFHLDDLFAHIADGGNDFFHHFVVGRQSLHPTRQLEIHSPDAELQKYVFHNAGDVPFRHIERVYNRDGGVIFFFKFRFERLSGLGGGFRRVEHNCKRFARGFEFGNHAFLGGNVFRSGNVREGPVGGYGKRYRAVLADNFVGAYFRRFGERHILVRPRRGHHSFLAALFAAERARHEVSHAVYQTHIHGKVVRKRDPRRLRGHELGLSGHNGFAVGGLRNFVHGACSGVLALYTADDEFFHKLFDDC